MKNCSLLLLFALILFSLTGCDDRRVYEKNQDFKGNDWYVDSVANFSFQINNTSDNYNLLCTVRNAVSYPFANLYIRYYLFDPQGKMVSSKQLRLPLFDKKTGKPFGDGIGDIFDHKFNLLRNYHFKEPGNYKVQIKQYMRQDPLPFIMAVGLRVEKAEIEEKN